MRNDRPSFAQDDQRPVIVGVDDSDSAHEATSWAADLASIWRAPLVLLHAVPYGHGTPAEEPSWLRSLAARAVRPGLAVSAEIVPGGAEEILLERSSGARLVAVGSYGEGAAAGMLSGTVAAALAAGSACPVAVVRGVGTRVSPSGEGPVVVGVDGSPAGAAALRFAADIAARLGSRLVAVHAWTDVLPGTEGGVHRASEGWEVLAERGATDLADALEPVFARYPLLVVGQQVVHDTPLQALIDLAGSARMLVVGDHGVEPRRGMLIGSTSAALVAFAPCPVIIIPSGVPAGAAPVHVGSRSDHGARTT